MTYAGRVLFAFAAMLSLRASALDISNRYRSPRNPERKVRATTQLIVLHTTEAPARSSLNKLSERGEAHYCVTEAGMVYRIVDRDREAFHAGRSMWNGREDVDKFSIGIECVGYHDKPMPAVQVRAIGELLRQLQPMYRIPDERVVCHSHVAYGSPNKWQKRRHRGRKRCGMLFAMPSMRRALGLQKRPAFDADTRAGRLAVGDVYLQKVLYGKADTMAGKCGTAASSRAPSAGGWLSSLFSRRKVAAKPVAKPVAKPAAKSVAKKPAASAKPPSASAKSAKRKPAAPSSPPKTIAQLKARGYVNRGTVSKTVSASKIAGRRWNASDTYYTIRNKVISGATIDDSRIEKGMCVWLKK